MTAAGLYVHWPFCKAKCPYCDFNSHVRAGVDHGRWARALTNEVRRAARDLKGRAVGSIFFGGGTPSLMAPETVAAVIEAADDALDLAPDCEITLEANPTSVEQGKLEGFKAAGVNRVSLGVQALNDADLRALGREHDAEEAIRALETARALFGRVSFDLIYARPNQTPATWEDELGRALRLGAGHVSLYQLTIEPGTRFHALWRAGLLRTPGEAIEADLYALTEARMSDAGYAAYEVSNFAVPGHACKHNLVYWRYGVYAGIGPGAHGRILSPDGARYATATHRAPEAWLRAVERDGTGEHPRERLSPAETVDEALLMGLRLAEGVPLGRIEALAGRSWAEAIDAKGLARLLAAGLVEIDGDHLRATSTGRLALDRVLPALSL